MEFIDWPHWYDPKMAEYIPFGYIVGSIWAIFYLVCTRSKLGDYFDLIGQHEFDIMIGNDFEEPRYHEGQNPVHYCFKISHPLPNRNV